MNEDKDKLDDLFRRGLEDPVDQTSYRETDWDSLAQMLDKHKKRRGVIYWLPILSSVAALLLLFLGWLFYMPKNSQHQQPQKQAVNRVDRAGNGTEERAKPKPVHQQALPVASNYVNNYNQKKVSNGGKGSITPLGTGTTAGNNAGNTREEIVDRPSSESLTAMSYLPAVEQGSVTAYPVNSYDIPRSAMSPAGGDDARKNKIKLQSAFRRQFALTVLAAPDINGVGSFQQSKVGTNIGLLFSAGVSKKFTISTGVIYSDKPYITGFANYHTGYKFATDPVNVTADCRMLDIPLNIGYQIYNKRQNRISVGTGLSSYIMLNQNFKFNYADSYITGPSHYEVSRNEKYLFGVVNFSATYQRQLSSKVSLSLQPYLKLPMTNIGYSEVRLQTTGVAVGINWNLNSLTKR